MPDWQPDPEEERQARRWPLRLLTAPGYFQSHTVFSGVSYLRRREGPPCCILHPQEAGARGLCDGQHVRLFNDHGSVGLVLKVSDEVQPGVVLVPGRAPMVRRWPGRSICCAPTATPISARVPRTRAPGSILRPGRTACDDEQPGLSVFVTLVIVVFFVEVAFVDLSADLARP